MLRVMSVCSRSFHQLERWSDLSVPACMATQWLGADGMFGYIGSMDVWRGILEAGVVFSDECSDIV